MFLTWSQPTCNTTICHNELNILCFSERQKAVQQRDPAMYSMEVEVQFSPLPPHVKNMVR